MPSGKVIELQRTAANSEQLAIRGNRRRPVIVALDTLRFTPSTSFPYPGPDFGRATHNDCVAVGCDDYFEPDQFLAKFGNFADFPVRKHIPKLHALAGQRKYSAIP